MATQNYLKWLSTETKTAWWHDSADTAELLQALANGAVGVTTNPVLVSQSLQSKRDLLLPHQAEIEAIKNADERAEKIIQIITQDLAQLLLPVYNETNGENGYVCAQVNPNRAGDANYMIEIAIRLSKWAPNISVKLPVTAAGLIAIEECVSLGMNITGTVSFTVPQAIAVAQRYEKGFIRAKKAGNQPKMCDSVIMVGRLDDYIREVAHDRSAGVAEKDLIYAGTAAMKKAYEIFKKNHYQALLQPAGMRGSYHAIDLTGAKMRFSVHPKIQKLLLTQDFEWKENIDIPVAQATVDNLCKISEFVRAYEPDGMKPEEFITYGVTQKTLAQFSDAWAIIASYKF